MAIMGWPADLEAHKKKRQKKATKEELLAEAEHKQADRQTLATSVEGQVRTPPPFSPSFPKTVVYQILPLWLQKNHVCEE